METLIEFRNTNFAYNNTNAFNDFNMEILEGDIVTLIGTSGSGKTTLLKMLCNRLPNDTVFYKGKNIKSYEIKELQKDIIVVFDAPTTMPTVREELVKHLAKLGANKEIIDERLEELNRHFGLDEIIGQNIKELGKEELYLVKILRYLIIKPKFMAIDNILNNLSKKAKTSFFSYIKTNKITLLNVTTNLDESLYGNKLYVLENFVLILEGSTLSVLKTDTLLKRLGFKIPLPVELSIELNHYEVIKKIYTDKEKLVNALWK